MSDEKLQAGTPEFLAGAAGLAESKTRVRALVGGDWGKGVFKKIEKEIYFCDDAGLQVPITMVEDYEKLSVKNLREEARAKFWQYIFTRD